MTKKIVIIGGGYSGITSIKACLEGGLEPICFEKSDQIGGLWRFREDDIEGLGSVTRNTIIKTSKEMTAFSDFTPPDDFPNFMPNGYVLKYLELYAEHFNLVQHVRFRHEVLKVEKTPNFAQSGEWKVTVRNNQTGEQQEMVVQGVMVCIGHHVYPNYPKIPGLESFQGTVEHTHSYKYGDKYRGKKVVVVGIGNSGGDAASELANIADKVYLCTRRGAWIWNGVGPHGQPFDMMFNFNSRISVFYLSKFLTNNYINNMWEKMVNERFDHEKYNMKPAHRILGQHPTINDDLPYRILNGLVTVKGDIAMIKPKGVTFKGEDQTEYEADALVLATGYNIRFPFLDPDILSIDRNHVEVYKYQHIPDLEKPTLTIIGLLQPLGCIFPLSELQARWFVQIINGESKLPSKEKMMKDIKSKNSSNEERYAASQRHTIQVDWAPFMEELAGEVGCRPSLFWLALTDPKLFWACLMEPITPYQYRLFGPNRWAGARDAILNCNQRVYAALSNRKYKVVDFKENRKKSAICSKVLALGFVVGAAGVLFVFREKACSYFNVKS